MQIKEMEEALGGVLLERSARQVTLTKFGEEIVQRVRDILRSVDELGDFARASRDRLAGRLRIGMIPTIAPYLLPKVIENLTRMHPELDIHVRETLTPKLIKEVVEGRLDTAIVALPVSEPSLTEVALFSENFLLVRPGEDEGTPVPSRETLREMRLLAAGRGTLFPRPGAVVLQDAVVAAAGSAGRKLAVDARADGRRRHRRHLDPGNGGGGGDTLGVGLGRALQESAALANHRHGLAQDKSAGRDSCCKSPKWFVSPPTRCASSTRRDRHRAIHGPEPATDSIEVEGAPAIVSPGPFRFPVMYPAEPSDVTTDDPPCPPGRI